MNGSLHLGDARPQSELCTKAFFRWKGTLGDLLRAKHFETQKREAIIASAVLNRMFGIGKPSSYAVAL